MANEQLAFLQNAVCYTGTGMQGFQLLAKFVHIATDVQEHEEDASVSGVVTVMIHVGLHLCSATCARKGNI